MKMHKLFLLTVACTWALGAAAQWQWIDKDGRKVFSDRPPPSDIPEKSILKQPTGAARASAVPVVASPASADNAAPAATASQASAKPALPGKDKELEEKKARAEAAEAAKKKVEEERVARAKVENCSRARQTKSTLESGRPVMHTNAKGEQGFMDESTRNAEIKRANDVIASDCAR